MEQSPFQIRGVVEGFYGPFYTWPERKNLIQFIGKHGYNLYIYGPKNDRQHRSRWREPYPAAVTAHFARTVALAHSVGVTFCYAISPLNYVPEQDFARVTTKLRALYDCGVRAFSIFMDDIACTTHSRMNCLECCTSADLHVELCNRLYGWLQTLDPQTTLSMCPDFYHGRAPFSPYLHDLGARLDPAVNVFYTGPDICCTEITTADARDFAQALQRPPVIWDNYPVNDLDMRPELHIGPIQGRSPDLYTAVRGIVVNPMLQAEASKIPLLTFADYFRDPHGYDPWRSWERALRTISSAADYEALRCFAPNALQSCLCADEPVESAKLVDAAEAALQNGTKAEQQTALAAVRAYLDRLDEACYHLKNRMRNLRLRDNLLPWIETLEDWLWLGKHVLELRELQDQGTLRDHHVRALRHRLDATGAYSKRSGGQSLRPLLEALVSEAEQYTLAHDKPVESTILSQSV